MLAADDPRHGTHTGYRNHGCRCALCRQANADHERHRTHQLGIHRPLEQAVAERKASRPPEPLPHLMFQQYIERLGRRHAKPHTITNFKRTAILWKESGLDPMTAEDWQIEEWLAGLPVSPRTRVLHLENLSAAYNYAVRRRLLSVAPTETVRLPRLPDEEPRILEPGELRHMLDNVMTDMQELMLATLMFTGMRRSEARNLKWEDISPVSMRVVGKGGKLRHVPLHPALGEILVWMKPKSEYLFPGRGGRKAMTDTAFTYQLKKVRGDVDCSFHDFRRTVATSLTENGVPEGIIDRIMGWAPRTVGRRYYIRRADDSMQEAILRLYADDPISLKPTAAERLKRLEAQL